ENLSGEERQAHDALDPVHGRTMYLIRRPNGSVVRYRPMHRRCSERHGRDVVLHPPRAGPRYDSNLYESIQLSYGAEGFYFMEPGHYQIQAIYQGFNRPITSAPIDLWIRHPDRAMEDLIVPTFRADVAAYLAGWGVGAAYDAERELQTLIAQAPAQPRARRAV